VKSQNQRIYIMGRIARLRAQVCSRAARSPPRSRQLPVVSCQLSVVVDCAARNEAAGEPCPKAAIGCNRLQLSPLQPACRAEPAAGRRLSRETVTSVSTRVQHALGSCRLRQCGLSSDPCHRFPILDHAEHRSPRVRRVLVPVDQPRSGHQNGVRDRGRRRRARSPVGCSAQSLELQTLSCSTGRAIPRTTWTTHGARNGMTDMRYR